MRRQALALLISSLAGTACGARSALDAGGSPPAGASNVPPAPACAAAAPVATPLFEDPRASIGDLAVDADAVYLTEVNHPDVWRIDKCSGTARRIAAPPTVDGPAMDLVVAGDHAAWLVLGDWLIAAPTAGGDAVTLVAAQQDRLLGEALAADDRSAYFLGGPVGNGPGTLAAVPIDGVGAPVPLFKGWDGPVAVDSTRVYAAQSPPTGNALLSIAKGGGASRVLVPSVHSSAFASDDVFLYWLEWADQGKRSAVMRVPKGGGVPVTLVADQPSPSAIAVDAGYVYWVAARSDPPTVRALLRAPKTGGSQEVVTTGAIGAVAVDQRTLFWSAGRTLMKLDK